MADRVSDDLYSNRLSIGKGARFMSMGNRAQIELTKPVSVNNRAKSLILRHHETLSKALGYVDGIEDLRNTPDKAQLYMTRAGIFTLLQRPTQCEWPSPMIFYIAEARDEDTRRFEGV